MKEDIRIRRVIMHILDTQQGICVYSEREMDIGSDFSDFLKDHISRIMESDEKKECIFEPESQVKEWVRALTDENFVQASFCIANRLHTIMEYNIEIPAADFFVILYQIEGISYLAFLKMNYKRSYTHRIQRSPEANTEVAVQKATLPGNTQKLTEAAVICLKDRERLYVVEKRYEVNGVRTNYFSKMFLECRDKWSEKEKLSIVQRTMDNLQKKYYAEHEQVKKQIETAVLLEKELEEKGKIEIQEIIESLENEEMQQEAKEKLERYQIENDRLEPQNDNTRKKLSFQSFKTDTGIEIKIPTREFEHENIQFMDCEDGTMQMLIGNFCRIEKK